MNPFLFKAHPLLQATIGCLAGTGCTPGLWVGLLATYLLLNLPIAALTSLSIRRLLPIRLRFAGVYAVALPITLLFLPIVLTLLADVLRHDFRLEDRFIFIFALFVATILLGALVGSVLRYRNGEPVGMEYGVTIALALLLACIPYGLLLLGADSLLGFLPAPSAER